MLIYGYIETEVKKHKFYAFNDVVITRPTISHMAKIDAFIDSDWFNSYYWRWTTHIYPYRLYSI